MTRKEFTNTRELTFSKWIRDKLPDSSTGFLVSDLDFILENWKVKKVMLLEIKTRNSDLKSWQNMLFKNLNCWFKEGVKLPWEYLGFYIVKFENTFFNDGKCFIKNIEEKNFIEISEKDLISKLSFLNIKNEKIIDLICQQPSCQSKEVFLVDAKNGLYECKICCNQFYI